MTQTPYYPEMCFETAAGRFCIPILTGPTFPYPSPQTVVPRLENWKVIRSPEGEITKAVSCAGAEQLSFGLKRETTKDVAVKTFTLSRNGEVLITMGGRAHLQDGTKQRCEGKLSMFVKGEDIDYQMAISRESSTAAHIVVESRQGVQERSVDLLSPACVGNSEELGLCRSLGEPQKERLEPFKDLLLAVNNFYWERGRQELASLPDQLKNPLEADTQASIWCGVARAGCWGLAAAGGAACCVGTATIGCVVCAGGFGAAGSACSEAWSWC